MKPNKFKTLRQSLFCSPTQLGQVLTPAVGEQRVLDWEAGRAAVPRSVQAQLWDLHTLFTTEATARIQAVQQSKQTLVSLFYYLTSEAFQAQEPQAYSQFRGDVLLYHSFIQHLEQVLQQAGIGVSCAAAAYQNPAIENRLSPEQRHNRLETHLAFVRESTAVRHERRQYPDLAQANNENRSPFQQAIARLRLEGVTAPSNEQIREALHAWKVAHKCEDVKRLDVLGLATSLTDGGL